MNTMRAVICVVMLIVVSGCLNTRAQILPINNAVKEIKIGFDCAEIVFGFANGSVTYERAAQQVRLLDPQYNFHELRLIPPTTGLHITRVRSVNYTEFMTIFGGDRCIEVIGE